MRFSKVLSLIIAGFVIGLGVLLIVSFLPIGGGIKLFVVQSGSMEPAIKTGSIVVVRPAKDYQIGEVITFGPYSKKRPPTTHRIYDIKMSNGQPVYITKGDANNAPDPRELTKKDILGKVLFSVPYLGFVVAFAKKPAGFILLVILPAIIIIFDQIRVVIKEIKKRKI